MRATVVGQRYTLRIRDAEYLGACPCPAVGLGFARLEGATVIRLEDAAAFVCEKCGQVAPWRFGYAHIFVDDHYYAVPEWWLEPLPVAVRP